MSKTEKIGQPRIKDPEGGADVELGQPVFEQEFEKESIEAIFPVIREALDEFYKRRINHNETAFILGVTRNIENIYSLARAELMSKNSDATLAISIIESARGELQYERNSIEFSELESEDKVTNQEREIVRQKNFEKDLHYQEATDILFSHDGYGVPTRPDFTDWLSETKKMIKKLAKEEEEKFRGAEEGEGIGKRPFRSKLLTDVPAIERFENGRETTRDYREIIDVIESRLLAERDRISFFVAAHISDSKSLSTLSTLKPMAKLLANIRKTELFLAMAEGERNERIAKKQL